VYADWLLARDDPRGQGIVLGRQLAEAAGLPAAERKALQRQYKRLCVLEELGAPGIADVREWRNGFVWRAEFTGPHMIETYLTLRRHPAGRLLHTVEFRLRQNVDQLDEIGACEGLRGLPALVLRSAYWRQPLDPAPLAASPNLSEIGALVFQTFQLGSAGAAAIAGSAHLRGLTELNLHASEIGDEGAAAIAAAAGLTGLVSLNLGWNEITDAGAQALAGARGLRSLRSLDLRWNRITREGARALVSSEALPDLSAVELHGNAVRSGELVGLPRAEIVRLANVGAPHG